MYVESLLQGKFTEQILYFGTDFYPLCEHFSSLTLFKIALAVSLLPATHPQNFILVLSLPLRRLRVTFFQRP